MTLVANCKLTSLNPQHYPKDVSKRRARGWPDSRLGELLPRSWVPETPMIGPPTIGERLLYV